MLVTEGHNSVSRQSSEAVRKMYQKRDSTILSLEYKSEEDTDSILDQLRTENVGHIGFTANGTEDSGTF